MSYIELSPDEFRMKKSGEKTLIFDPLRRKYVTLTPEERVRQYFTSLLIKHMGYPAGRFGNEISLKLNGRSFRCDSVVYNECGLPLVIIEYKAADISITQAVFDQIVRYNMVLKVEYLFVTNGLSFYGCRLNYETMSYTFLQEVPLYADLTL